MASYDGRGGIRRLLNPQGPAARSIMPIALVAVVIAAVAYGLFNVLTYRGSRRPVPEEIHFKCMECGKESIKRGKEAREVDSSLGAIPVIDCPKCNAKAAAIEMRPCPKCGELFVNPQHELYYRIGADAFDRYVPLICPHCDTDVHKFMREQRKKKTRTP